MTTKELLGKKLLFITAHPDDETFLASGTIYANFKAGGKSAIVCATNGEKGKARVGEAVTEKQLAEIRKKELEKVSKILKVDWLIPLNLPDRNLGLHARKIHKKITQVVRSWKPDVVISFGPDGVSGHLDHICVGKVAKNIAKEFKVPFLAFAASPSLVKEFHLAKLRRSYGAYSKEVVHQGHTLKIKANSKVKKQAFLCHKSQDLFAHLSKEIINEVLNYDFFCC